MPRIGQACLRLLTFVGLLGGNWEGFDQLLELAGQTEAAGVLRGGVLG